MLRAAVPAVTQRVRHIPFRSLEAGELHARHLEDHVELIALLGRRPRSCEEVLKKAPLATRRLIPPDKLAHALVGYAQRHAAPPPVLDAARAVADGKTLFVVTGQQPGLFGGPLYTIHKVATAIQLARELSKQSGLRVVPLFWNHTDDHDLDEMNRSFLVNQSQELQRFRLEIESSGECVRDLPIGRAFEGVLEAATALLPASEFREWALTTLKPRHPDEHLGDAQARLLFSLFGKHGLLVIEPRDLPAEAQIPLPKWFEATNVVRSVTRATADDIADLGLDVTIDPGATLMFEISGGRRNALADGQPLGRADNLSPGAILRPLWQDACLATIASVVGPGELSYLAVAGPLYQKLGVPQPVLVPRASMTLVEPSLAKLMLRYRWDLPDLKEGPDRLAKTLPLDEQSAVEEGLDDLSNLARSRLQELANAIREADASMLGAFERTEGKVVEELQKLLVKLRNSRQNRQGTGQRQVRRLCNNLMPKGRLQERVLPILPFLVAHGEALGDQILLAADPFATAHIVLEL